MKMTFRWYGPTDRISLKYISQIPGVKGIVGNCFEIPTGEVVPLENIMNLKKTVEKAGFTLDVLESVNVHEEIKAGGPDRDLYIQNYQESIRNLGKAGVKTLCYNLMPIFDWLRTDLTHEMKDGSFALFYDGNKIKNMTLDDLVEEVRTKAGGIAMPGWDLEFLEKKMKPLYERYKSISKEQYWNNLKYFLEKVIPVAEECDVKMAIHPDDPPWDIFGLPRVINNRENIMRFLNMVDSKHNGLTICSGSLGAEKTNDIPALVKEIGSMGKLHFGHIRNVIHTEDQVYSESPHVSECGDLDLYEITKAYYELDKMGYNLPVRPDHGRMIWGEQGMPGYGLYDRALGAVYIVGLYEAIVKNDKKH